MDNQNVSYSVVKLYMSAVTKEDFPEGVKRLTNKSNKGRSRQIAYIYQVLDELYEKINASTEGKIPFDEMVSLVMSNADVPGVSSNASKQNLMYDALECSLNKISKGNDNKETFYSVLNFLSSDAFVRSYEIFKKNTDITEEQVHELKSKPQPKDKVVETTKQEEHIKEEKKGVKQIQRNDNDEEQRIKAEREAQQRRQQAEAEAKKKAEEKAMKTQQPEAEAKNGEDDFITFEPDMSFFTPPKELVPEESEKPVVPQRPQRDPNKFRVF